MRKYTYTMALATINECHNRECHAGHWIAAGITGQLHADFVKMADRPEVTIPTVEDIRPAVTRYVRRLSYTHKYESSELINLWVDESNSEWGIFKDFPGIPMIPSWRARVSCIIYPDSHPSDICHYLISALREEVDITDVDDEHPLLRDLRSETDPKAIEAIRSALTK